jgi:hypothetical protein
MERQGIIQSHRQLVLQLRDLEKQIEALLAINDPQWRKLESQRSELRKQIEPLIEAYWQWIPQVELSQCPYCQQGLMLPFDAEDLNGFWWMDRTQRPAAQVPQACEHFRLLLGAVNFNGLKPEATLFESHPGPNKPFVIPRILQMPSMLAVISEIPMDCGYTAYPIAYFSKETPAKGSLTQAWARKEYVFTLDDGSKGWDIKSEQEDFDLKAWGASKKLLIYREGVLKYFESSATN